MISTALPKEGRPPAGWGEDRLTDYCDTFRQNQHATFCRKQPDVELIIRIDKGFHTFFDGVINPRPWFPAQFILRAHSALKAASGAAMARQLYELNSVLRSCLELAAYGLYIGKDVRRAELWLRRHDDANTLAAMKREFTIANIKNHIRRLAPKVAEHFDTLYEGTIDFGGHPNERGFSSNMNIHDLDDGSKQFLTIYLQSDHRQIAIALKRTGQVGLWALIAAQLIWKERFELLGIRAEIDELRKVL